MADEPGKIDVVVHPEERDRQQMEHLRNQLVIALIRRQTDQNEEFSISGYELDAALGFSVAMRAENRRVYFKLIPTNEMDKYRP